LFRRLSWSQLLELARLDYPLKRARAALSLAGLERKPSVARRGEDDPVAGETTVVTAYEPDARRWKAGFRERKRQPQ